MMLFGFCLSVPEIILCSTEQNRMVLEQHGGGGGGGGELCFLRKLSLYVNKAEVTLLKLSLTLL